MVLDVFGPHTRSEVLLTDAVKKPEPLAGALLPIAKPGPIAVLQSFAEGADVGRNDRQASVQAGAQGEAVGLWPDCGEPDGIGL